jgi:hypothetical protein
LDGFGAFHCSAVRSRGKRELGNCVPSDCTAIVSTAPESGSFSLGDRRSRGTGRVGVRASVSSHHMLTASDPT